METLTENPKADPPCVLERSQRVSNSILWELQRNYFARQGIEAWRQNVVPHYVTSNPFIAAAYATVVFGFLRDCQAASACPLDCSQPVYIVELGSGSGRFAFHFLKEFLAVLGRSALRHILVKYVMTDFAQGTLDYWQAHPSLRPFVEAGQLDFARFDAGSDCELALSHAGEILAPGTVKNPLVVLANYFFDGIPQDAFAIQDGQLYESLITVTSSQEEHDLSDPDLLNRVDIAYEHRPVDGDYYDDPDCDRILAEYQRRLPNTALLFPCAAIRCIRDLGRLSGGRLLLLSADKGYSREGDLLGRAEPAINVHGSFSMMVNYHALGQYVCHQGGQALGTDRRHNSLNVSAFVLGAAPNNAIETRQAYAAAIDQFGPDDFFTLKKGIEKLYDNLTLPQMLAYLRLSRWDASILLGCFPTLLEWVDSLSEPERQELYGVIRRVWDVYYPIGEKLDLAFYLGMLLYGMAYYPEAIEFFGHSLRLYGPDASSAYNIGMCHYNLRQLEAALAWVDQALELDPAFGAARGMRIEIQEEMGRYGAGEGNTEETQRRTGDA
jgi:tetratricopeptide (TPR) repeat protein